MLEKNPAKLELEPGNQW